MKHTIDLITKNSSGSSRVFLTIEIKGKDYETFIDCPLNMTDTPEWYIEKNLEKIAGDIQKEQSAEFEEAKRDYKHPPKIRQMKEIEKAKTLEEKVGLLVKMISNMI